MDSSLVRADALSTHPAPAASMPELSKETWAACARAARLATPRLIERGFLVYAANLARRADEFERRS